MCPDPLAYDKTPSRRLTALFIVPSCSVNWSLASPLRSTETRKFLAHAIADIKSERARFRSLNSTMNISKICALNETSISKVCDFNFRFCKNRCERFNFLNQRRTRLRICGICFNLETSVIITHRYECRCASSCRFSGGISSHRTDRDTVSCPSGLKDEYLECWSAWTLCRTACTRTPSPRNARLCVA